MEKKRAFVHHVKDLPFVIMVGISIIVHYVRMLQVFVSINEDDTHVMNVQRVKKNFASIKNIGKFAEFVIRSYFVLTKGKKIIVINAMENIAVPTIRLEIVADCAMAKITVHTENIILPVLTVTGKTYANVAKLLMVIKNMTNIVYVALYIYFQIKKTLITTKLKRKQWLIT